MKDKFNLRSLTNSIADPRMFLLAVSLFLLGFMLSGAAFFRYNHPPQPENPPRFEQHTDHRPAQAPNVKLDKAGIR